MPDVTLSFSSPNLQRVVDFYANTKNYQGTKLPGETQNQFAKRMLIEELRRAVQQYEHGVLQAQALANAPADITAT